jgi:hypothetical protein
VQLDIGPGRCDDPRLRRASIASSDGPVQAGGNPDGLLADDPGRPAPLARLRALRGALIKSRAWLTPGRVEVACLALLAALLIWLQGGAVLASLEYTLDPYRLNGDAQQQIFPFFRYLEPNSFRGDYIADYYLSSYPLGYRVLYALPAWLGVDPTRVSRALPHALWLCTALGVGAVAHRLGGKLAAFCAMALVLGSNLYLNRIQGGLPRSFGFPIVALALVGLAYARVGWCVASVLAGALFYPVAGVVSGFSLAALLLLPERSGFSVSGWSWRRRISTLGITALLSVALLVPSLLGTGRFGGAVRPRDVPEYPEAGPGGRYSSESRAPFPGFLPSVPEVMNQALIGARSPWSLSTRRWLIGKKGTPPLNAVNYRRSMWGLLALVVVGGLGLLAREPAARRVALLGVAAGLGYNLARLVLPFAYLPERYVAYAVPLLGTIAVTTCIAGLFGASFAEGRRRWIRRAAIAGHVLVLSCMFAGRVTANAGITADLRGDRRLFEQISRLPEDALVAGWPKGLMNAVPYAGRRPALLTHECHQAFHKGYIEEMRRRMGAFLDAYFATSPEPLLRLRQEFGVTHLLLQRSHFSRRPPGYFRPFGEWIKARTEAARGKKYELSRQMRAAAMFSSGDYVLLDLSKVEPRGASGEAASPLPSQP